MITFQADPPIPSMPHPIHFNIDQALPELLKVTAPLVGADYLTTLIGRLISLTGADLIFMTRAQNHPATRVRIVASSSTKTPSEFDLQGTPCQTVLQGRALCIPENLCHLFEGPRDSGFQSFIGYPFFDQEKQCIGHLGMFFQRPIKPSPALDQLIAELQQRIEAELLRLDLETRLATQLRRIELHNEVLRLTTENRPLDEVLNRLIHGIEEEDPHLHCAVLLPDRDNQYLAVCAAPSLPPEYSLSLHGIRIADGLAFCGNTLGLQLSAQDIRTHPAWDKLRSTAGEHGLVSCWSTALADNQEKLIGLLSIYQQQAAVPRADDIALWESVAQLVQTAIQHARMQESLRVKTRKSQIYLQTAFDGVIVLDLDGKFIEVSDGWLAMTGATRKQTMASRIWDWDTVNDEAAFRARADDFLEHPVCYETVMRTAAGTLWHAEVNAVAFSAEGEKLIWASARDTSDRKQREENLLYRANTDELTGTMSRRMFMDEFSVEFQRSQRHQRPLAVLMLDLDYFKQINDRFGHACGDHALRATAQACRESLRKEDRLGRLGGEEFAMILPETDPDAALEAANRIRSLIAALNIEAPHRDRATPIRLTCSIGVACLLGHEANHEELLARADVALYQAKNAGRNQVFLDDE